MRRVLPVTGPRVVSTVCDFVWAPGSLWANVGVAIALIGYAAFLSHPLALFAAFLFPVYIGRFQIAPEERALDQVFGEAYEAYKKRVPRWF